MHSLPNPAKREQQRERKKESVHMKEVEYKFILNEGLIEKGTDNTWRTQADSCSKLSFPYKKSNTSWRLDLLFGNVNSVKRVGISMRRYFLTCCSWLTSCYMTSVARIWLWRWGTATFTEVRPCSNTSVTNPNQAYPHVTGEPSLAKLIKVFSC